MPNVWHIPLCSGAERIKVNGKKAHATQKPEALLYRVILASSNVGDVVLDPFFGSGTTGAVAKKLGRRFIGIERESAYVEVARTRLAAVQPALPDQHLWVTPSKRDQARVSFGRLVETNYVHVGQVLYDKTRQHQALVCADGALMSGTFRGSIHKVAAHLLGQSAHNGWEFWYIERDGTLISIDSLREQYRAARL